MDSLVLSTQSVQRFCEERDWDQFHNPKDLAIGISTEANELLDLFRFKSDTEMAAMLDDPLFRGKIAHELADVFFFLIRFGQRFDFDLLAALQAKLEVNAGKYPIHTSRGSNRKYSEQID